LGDLLDVDVIQAKVVMAVPQKVPTKPKKQRGERVNLFEL